MHSHGTRNGRVRLRGLLGALGLWSALGAGGALAGAEIKIGDDATFNAGLGVRLSYTRADNAAPDGISKSNDFNVENARLFLGGSYGKIVKATFNTERTSGSAASGGDRVRVMDAIAQFEFMPEFNFWLGRMLPPSDRANLYGPFYAVPWSFPGVVSNYPNLAVGRDNGALVWGKTFQGKLVYSAGVFEGHNKAAGLSAEKDKPLYAARVAYNFWDPEPAPAYYTGGWYGGSNDILTVGLSGNSQKDGVGTAAAPGELKVWSADLLVEKKLAAGVPTFEAAYYKYKVGAVDCGSGEPGAPACPTGDNIGGQVDGKAYLLGGAFLFPQAVGMGQFQPFARLQRYKRSLSGTTAKSTDLGVNYLIKGPNARVTLMYTKTHDDRNTAPRDSVSQLTLGVQLMY
jgi:Phosphate-selective porin O and P